VRSRLRQVPAEVPDRGAGRVRRALLLRRRRRRPAHLLLHGGEQLSLDGRRQDGHADRVLSQRGPREDRDRARPGSGPDGLRERRLHRLHRQEASSAGGVRLHRSQTPPPQGTRLRHRRLLRGQRARHRRLQQKRQRQAQGDCQRQQVGQWRLVPIVSGGTGKMK
jgi:hypothetical protein